MIQLKANGLTVGDMFCGAGIGAVGTKLAGFKTVFAFDNNKYAVDTFNKNIEPVAYIQDAKTLSVDSLPYADVITAGFPCKPFSVCGNQLGQDDPDTGNLGFITLQTILRKEPKAFLIENVSGLVNKRNMQFFLELVQEFSTKYNVTWQLINCAEYGVPQKRMRVFVVGIRSDLEAEFEFPKPEGKIVSVKDAIGDLPKQPCSSVSNHSRDCGIRNDEAPYVDKIPAGGNWKDLPVEDQKAFMKKGYYSGGGRTGALWKVDPDKPAKTIMSSPKGKATAQILHWTGHSPRRYTVRESLRLQTVPDWFSFDEDIPLMKQYERCSGIPSKVMYLFMKQIGDTLNNV